MPKRVVGVVPAAGYATRLQPFAGSKEVYPVGGRPLMDYIVERMQAAPAGELRVVTRPDKEDVIEQAHRMEAAVVEGRPATLAQSIALGLEGLAPDDVALIGFPDSIWEPVDGFARLLAAFGERMDVVLGLFRSTEPERSDVVLLNESGLVTGVEVKPEQPRSDLIWGCAVARVSALDGLERRAWPGELFDELAHAGRVYGVRLPGEFLDVGTHEALRRALDRFGT
jgi:glucose-1-phosphate thymidylyltransferase